jgi:transcriptional regulator with XRE-family HTH domain
MRELNDKEELRKTRSEIARNVRELRKERRWTQAELAKRLDLSQARLSEIEGGDGSFTAEQFLLLLRLFNVGASRFVPSAGPSAGHDREAQIQNALARLGALHLQENRDVLPSERFDEVRSAVREALVLAESPRLLTALAPVLVANAEQVNLNKLQLELSEAGLPHRLPWLVENVLDVLEHSASETHSRAWVRARRRAYVLLRTFLDAVRTDPHASGAPDVLDSNIRSQLSRDEIAEASSPISKRWRVVTSLQPDDFAHALASAHAVGSGRARP